MMILNAVSSSTSFPGPFSFCILRRSKNAKGKRPWERGWWVALICFKFQLLTPIYLSASWLLIFIFIPFLLNVSSLPFHSFFLSFIHSFSHLFFQSFIHSLISSLIRAFIRSLFHSFHLIIHRPKWQQSYCTCDRLWNRRRRSLLAYQELLVNCLGDQRLRQDNLGSKQVWNYREANRGPLKTKSFSTTNQSRRSLGWTPHSWVTKSQNKGEEAKEETLKFKVLYRYINTENKPPFYGNIISLRTF